MISTACPECAKYNDQIGLCDGGCRPGCPNIFLPPVLADEEDLPLTHAKPRRQATRQSSQQLRHEGRNTRPEPVDMLQLGIEESQQFGKSQHMRWTRRTGSPS